MAKVKVTVTKTAKKPAKASRSRSAVDHRVLRAKAKRPAVQEGTLIATRVEKGSQLGTVVSQAMEDAIKRCYAEGRINPVSVSEAMAEAKDKAMAEWDKARGGGG